MSDQIIHDDGVYFDLPEDEYHADPALGSTDLKTLIVSPPDYWWQSDWNPVRDEGEKKDTPAKALGKGIHCYVLEGEEAFKERFLVEPSKDDYEGLLVTSAEIKDWCAKYSVVAKPQKGAKAPVKADWIEAALKKNPELHIWDHIQSVHRLRCEKEGKTALTRDQYQRIMLSVKFITGNPSLTKAFRGGLPEVSVFWTEITADGLPIRCKCRFDYLKQKATVDLKSFSNQSGAPIDEAVLKLSIPRFRYHIQAAWYMHGRKQARELFMAGKVFGEHDAEVAKKILGSDLFQWLWVFYKTDGAPVARGYTFPSNMILFNRGWDHCVQALATYERYLTLYGSDPWVDPAEIRKTEDTDFPAWLS